MRIKSRGTRLVSFLYSTRLRTSLLGKIKEDNLVSRQANVELRVKDTI
mgnify:CR=1 FL=1